MVEGIAQNPNVPEPVKTNATTQLAEGVPFVSDADLEAGLAAAGVDPALSEEILAENRAARIEGLDAAIAFLAIMAVISLFFTGYVPTTTGGTAEARRGRLTHRQENRSPLLDFRLAHGAIAQLGEHLHGMQKVRGSSPRRSTKHIHAHGIRDGSDRPLERRPRA